ncbi:hypothetical protein OAI75_00855 [Woeseiaceae bacterium]|nr:hypothetical protein [Woeseiaceae bacterium]
MARSRAMAAKDVQEMGLVLVPPGEYQLAFMGQETKYIFRSQKLYMHFRIVDFGPHFEKKVTRYYGVRIIGKPRKSGRFKAGWHSDLMTEYVSLFGRLPKRTSEIPITPYKKHILLGRVETVTNNRVRRPYPELLHYSRVAELLRVVR